MKRADVLAHIRIAGYHDDQATRVRLMVESRVSRRAADDAWSIGRVQRRLGIPCGCIHCKEKK
jgi:hypothetical protein